MNMKEFFISKYYYLKLILMKKKLNNIRLQYQNW